MFGTTPLDAAWNKSDRIAAMIANAAGRRRHPQARVKKEIRLCTVRPATAAPHPLQPSGRCWPRESTRRCGIGDAPLHLAAGFRGCPFVIEALLGAGVGVNSARHIAEVGGTATETNFMLARKAVKLGGGKPLRRSLRSLPCCWAQEPTRGHGTAMDASVEASIRCSFGRQEVAGRRRRPSSQVAALRMQAAKVNQRSSVRSTLLFGHVGSRPPKRARPAQSAPPR